MEGVQVLNQLVSPPLPLSFQIFIPSRGDHGKFIDGIDFEGRSEYRDIEVGVQSGIWISGIRWENGGGVHDMKITSASLAIREKIQTLIDPRYRRRDEEERNYGNL